MPAQEEHELKAGTCPCLQGSSWWSPGLTLIFESSLGRGNGFWTEGGNFKGGLLAHKEIFFLGWIIYYYYVVELEFELRALDLLGRHATTSATPHSPFCFSYLFFGETGALSLQSRCSTTRAIPPVHFALVILEMGSCKLFARLPRTAILWISASK
jgi:hypothetical protein